MQVLYEDFNDKYLSDSKNIDKEVMIAKEKVKNIKIFIN